MTTGKTIALTIQTFVSKVLSLIFNTLSSFVIAFLPRSTCLKFMAAVTVCSDFGAQGNKVCHCFHCFRIICHEMISDAMTFVFWKLSFKPTFSLSSFTFKKRLFSSSLLSAIRVVLFAYLRLLIVLPAIMIPTCASSSPAFLTWCTVYISYIRRVTVYKFDISLSQFWTVHCSMSGSNCCFLTSIQVSQEVGKMAWYFHLFKNLLPFVVSTWAKVLT